MFHYLFNIKDNSYNYHSEEPIPDFMKSGTFEVESEVNPNSFIDVVCTFYNPETQTIYENLDLFRVDSPKGHAFLVEQLTAMLATPGTDSTAEFQLFSTLAQKFLPADVYSRIFEDSMIANEEATEILNYVESRQA